MLPVREGRQRNRHLSRQQRQNPSGSRGQKTVHLYRVLEFTRLEVPDGSFVPAESRKSQRVRQKRSVELYPNHGLIDRIPRLGRHQRPRRRHALRTRRRTPASAGTGASASWTRLPLQQLQWDRTANGPTRSPAPSRSTDRQSEEMARALEVMDGVVAKVDDQPGSSNAKAQVGPAGSLRTGVRGQRFAGAKITRTKAASQPSDRVGVSLTATRTQRTPPRTVALPPRPTKNCSRKTLGHRGVKNRRVRQPRPIPVANEPRRHHSSDRKRREVTRGLESVSSEICRFGD